MNTANKYNLLKLLSEYEVQIPILQRDFAQGRNKQKNVRDNFLGAIYDFLNGDFPSEMNFDFVYGYTESGKFLPIDGQQRLTTLWLLYVYLSSKVDNKNEYEVLENFSYATRDTADNFCDEILDVSFEKKPSIQLRENLMTKDRITDGDPTVAAMVVMLDAIHDKFCNCDVNKIIVRLNSIVFNVINMQDFKLGEDLYIKMNSRGKQLSSFENFKSWMQKDESVKSDFSLLSSIDNVWINFFWKRNNSGWESDIIKMISYISIFFILRDKKYTPKEQRDFLDRHLNENFSVFNERLFLINGEKILNFSLMHDIDKIIHFFENLENLNIEYPTIENHNTSFLIPKLFSIFFYALSENDISGLEDWISTTNHIIDNTRSTKERDHVISSFTLLEELSTHCGCIIDYLSKSPKIVSTFAKERVEEEKRKSVIITYDGRGNKWERAINEAQNHGYFKGWIDFMLDYSRNEMGYSYNDFVVYSKILCTLFEPEFLRDNIKLLQRALLSFSDYSIYYTNFYLGNSSTTDLQQGKEQWNKIFKEKKDIVLQLLNKINNITSDSSKDMIVCLNSIINENLNFEWNQKDWWRWLMVSDKIYLSYCEQNRFAHYDGNILYLIPKTKFYRKGINLLVFGFWKLFLDNHSKDYRVSNYSDHIEDDNFFTINDKIKVNANHFENIISIKKYGEGTRDFVFETRNHKDKLTLSKFYLEIINYIESIK